MNIQSKSRAGAFHRAAGIDLTLVQRVAQALSWGPLGAALLTSGLALANGDEFFQPAGNGKVDLVYFGQIKDTDGHVLDKALVTLSAKGAGLTLPFMNDVAGHYRSPDIGAAIKDLGEKVDPSQIEINCDVPGYKQIKPAGTAVPSKNSGAIEVDFVMEKVERPAAK
jgi:hypothetical protein